MFKQLIGAIFLSKDLEFLRINGVLPATTACSGTSNFPGNMFNSSKSDKSIRVFFNTIQ